MKKFLICLMLAGIVCPVVQAGFTPDALADGFLSTGEYCYIETFTGDNLYVVGGGGHYVKVGGNAHCEVDYTSEPMDNYVSGLWEVNLIDNATFVQTGGSIRTLCVNDDATVILRGGFVDQLHIHNLNDSPSATFEVLPGWQLKNIYDSAWLLHGQWADGSHFETIFSERDNSEYTVWENVQMIEVPEPVTLALLGLGGLLIRKRK